MRTLPEGGGGQVRTSLYIAKIIFGARPFRAAAIRHWAKSFALEKKIPVILQGRHQKTSSLIDDEDVRRDCVGFLRSQTADQRSAASFCKWFSETYFLKLTGAPRPTLLSECTARVWFEKMGWVMWEHSKGLYKDGHEAVDNVAYRNKFLDRIAVSQRRMNSYTGVDMCCECRLFVDYLLLSLVLTMMSSLLLLSGNYCYNT